MLKADRNLGLRKIHPCQKYFYCFISMETCWKGFKIINFETKLFFENVGKISTAKWTPMGRTILKYIYPWSVLHTFTIRWISALDMTLVRLYHIGKFTLKVIYSFQKIWPPRACYAPPEGFRELSFATELPETLFQVLRKFDHSILNGFAQRGVEWCQVIDGEKVDLKNTKCNCKPRFKRI